MVAASSGRAGRYRPRDPASDAAERHLARISHRAVRPPLLVERLGRTGVSAQQAERHRALRSGAGLGSWMQASIAVLAGDGIGGEVTAEAGRALPKGASPFRHRFEFESARLGGAAIDATGSPLPPATLELATRADAILLGAVGGPRWSDPNAAVRPEQGLLQLRKALGLFANLRPVVPHPAVLDASPIKAELLRGVDIMVVRELTGGIYFGEKTRTATEAVDICRYSVMEIERVVRLAANLARARRKKLTSVDKANVLETSRLWRSTVNLIMPTEFPDVAVEHMLVGSPALPFFQPPPHLAPFFTPNTFGAILTHQAAPPARPLAPLPPPPPPPPP